MTAAVRRHELVAHTADVGIRAQAPDLAGVFEEAAAALAELAADVEPGAPELPAEPVALAAADLAELAYGWLNELIGLADARRAALVAARIEEVAEEGGEWLLAGSVRLAAYDGQTVRPRLGVKSATYHELTVERRADGWTLAAVLDV